MINVHKIVRYSQIEKCMPYLTSTCKILLFDTYVEKKYGIFSACTDFSYSVCTDFWESHLGTLEVGTSFLHQGEVVHWSTSQMNNTSLK